MHSQSVIWKTVLNYSCLTKTDGGSIVKKTMTFSIFFRYYWFLPMK
jgi:hypothetical protein